MYQALIVIHVIVAAGRIGLVLIQHGKGADAGAAFGSGSSATVFGARGSASFLTRMTAALAAGFFVTSLALGYMTLQFDKDKNAEIVAPATQPEAPEPPATPADSDIPVVPDTTATTPAEPPADSEIPSVPEATPGKADPATGVNKIPE